MIVVGGVLAGMGAGIGLAIVLYAIEQVNPASFPSGIDGLVVVVLLIGPLIGLGLGMMAAGLIPDDAPRQAGPPVPPV
jgi:hypothetical protein